MKTYLLFILSFFYVWNGFSQSQERVHKHQAIQSIDYKKSISTKSFFQSEYQNLGLDSPKNMTQKYVIHDKSGFIHTKFKQSYHGIPVIGGTYILHEKNGLVKKSTGNIYPNISLSTKPTISLQDAIDEANYNLIERFSNKYKDFDPSRFNLDVTENTLCIIDKAYPSFSGKYRLAYEIAVKAFLNLPIQEKIYVDAQTNEVLNAFSTIAQEDVIGKGETLYYGERKFHIDSVSQNKYLLQDLTRGKGIFTIDASQDYDGSQDYGYPVFENDSKTWVYLEKPKDAAALDAHFSTIQYYDMLKNRFGRNSIDNDGIELVSAVHVGNPFYVNATWNGTNTNFGDGDCIDYGPLTTLDIVGHEFTHGLTDYTSQLIYKNESGAINEAISDIFGKALEWYTTPDDFNWLLGNTMITGGDEVEPFRNMADPNAVGDPKFYLGEEWKTGIGDNGGVHTNSNVFNHWFFLLVQGKAGKNETGYDYNVQKIGMDKAIDIVYGVETGYLTESSDYTDLFFATIDEAKALYGDNSMEVMSVIEAWKAVGVDETVTVNNLSISFMESYIPTVIICDFDTPYLYEYQLQNKGTKTYLPGETISLEFSINSEVLLTKDIILEDSLKYKDILTFADEIYLTKEQLTLNTNKLKLTLKSNDTNIADNELVVRFKNLSEDIDLRASIYTNTLRNLCTPIQQQGLRCRVQNLSCTPIHQGEKLNFVFENENGRFTQEYTLSEDLDPNRTKYVSLELGDLPVDFGPFDITMKFDGDVNLDNNTFLYDGPGVYKQMRRNIPIDFSDDSYKDFIKMRPSFYNRIEVVDFDNNGQLGILGAKNYGRLTECKDPNDFFISQIFSTMGMCVDASNMNDPMIAFDLTFIHNQTISDFSISDDYYTMTKVYLEEMEFPLIYVQVSESQEHQKIELPSGYSGIVQISVYVLGKENTNSSDIFKNNNWVLIDNINFYDKMDVANKDIPKVDFKVSPNPTAQFISFSSNKLTKSYEIRMTDILGHEVDRISNIQGTLNYDASKLDNGTYFYEIFQNNQRINFGKFVVIE